MAQPITTSGFSVSAQPFVRYADPASLVPQYGAILPSLQQGMNAVGQYQQMAELAQQRPIRRELAQLQLENERAQLAQLPLRRQLAELQLGEAQRQAALPQIIPGDTTFEDMTQFYPAAVDENGRPTGEGERVLGDLIQVQSVEDVGPGGVRTPRTIRKTVKTAAQRQAEAEKQAADIAGATSLASYREQMAEAATLRAENDRIKAEAAKDKAEALSVNPSVGFTDVKRADGNTYRQFYRKTNPAEVIHEINRGALSSGFFNFGGPVTVTSGANIAQPASIATDIDPEIAALAGLGTAAVNAPAAPARVMAQADRDALAWARANSKDPRAILIFQRLGTQ